MTAFRNLTFPSLQEPFVNPKTGVMASSWIQFFQQLQSQPAAIVAPVITASPMTYTASADGDLSISGGTVSLIRISRGRVTFTTGAISGIFPMAKGDSVIITYTVAPTLNFIPG